MKGQSRAASFVEALFNNVLGLFVALVGQVVILPILHIHLQPDQHVKVAASFAALSLVRSYFLRRLFNRISVRGASLVDRLRQYFSRKELTA